MKKIELLLGLVFLWFATSCDDFLDKQPHNALSTDNAITSMSDCQVALNGVYLHFKSGSYYGRNLVLLPDLMADNALAVSGFSNTYGIMYQWTFNSGTEEIENFWSIAYGAIVNASNLLDQIDAIPGDEAEKNNIKGQAYMARALAHFDLVRLYAKRYQTATAETELGVPVVQHFEIAEPARSTVAQVYAQVLADAELALGLIADDKADATTFTKGAVQAFLARVYLTMGNWDKAIEYSGYVIGNTKYKLADIDAYEDVFKNDKGSEIIWKIALTTGDAAGRNPGYYYYNDAQGLPNPDYMPTSSVLALYDQTDDVRFFTFFNEVKTKHGWTGYLVTKYPTNPLFATTTNANGSNMPKVFRLSEQYLIRAEAYAEKGGATNEANALKDLNELRRNRIDGYTDVSGLAGAALKDQIWKERRKEFAYEGQYWFDLKRKGMDFQRVPQANSAIGINHDQLGIAASSFRWVWPIPQSEMNANSNIPENNPGY